MLSRLLLLTGLGQLASAGHHSETARLQITVPRKIETNTKDGSISETHVSYSIQIDKKTYIFPLEKQSFLDSNLLVYSYNKSGVLYPDSSFIKGHCFYQGYATEIPNSAATLSTCSGLRGLLQFENVSYGIEPLESSTTYEHVIYPFRDKKSDFSPISENSSTTQFADQSYKILVKSNKDSGVLLKRVLKMRVIIDKALYDYMGSEVTLASEKIIYVFSLINTMYSQLQVSVILTSLEIWSDLNKISTDGDAHEVLQRFVSWREKNLLQSSHDLTYLLIYRDHPNYVGATYHGMACDPKFAAGLALTCVYSKCCDPLNCVLKAKADCGSGPCCGKNTCKILERGRECRKSIDPCDFPEFCNGLSEFCAPDMRAADLQMCNNKSSYCFGGICQDRTTQCTNLFGKYAKEASYQCAEEVNYQGDVFGNCLGKPWFFLHHLCGKLVCHWTHSLIVSRNDIHVQYTYLGGHICTSAYLRTRKFPDPTISSNGSMCDEDKFCDNGACKAVTQYSQYQDCDPLVKCKGHGICNSRLHCQCDAGYVPPDCLETASSPGGSIDDGFWNIEEEMEKSKTSDLIKRHRASQKNNLRMSFYVFLPFFILTAIIALKWKKMKIFWNKEGTLSGESPSEISSSNSSQSYSND